MPVVIIEDREKLKAEIEGGTFYYRRVPGHIRSNIMTACTNKRTGTVDWGKFVQQLLEYGLLGWDEKTVVDKKGTPIPFAPEIIRYLPDNVQGELMQLFGGNVEQIEDEDLPNSEHTPSSSS